VSETDIAHPDICFVIPPTSLDGSEIGTAPRMRHYADCSHFMGEDGTFLGTPVQATADQMRDLPACKTCVQREFGSEPGAGGREGRFGEPCPSCFMALPLTGVCDNCA